MSAELNYRESRLADGTRLVTLGGELDVFSAGAELEELLAECVECAYHVVLDMSQVSFVDSAGLALLVRTHRGLSGRGRRLVVLSPHANVRRLLQITGLDGRLTLADSRSDAEALLGAHASAAARGSGGIAPAGHRRQPGTPTG